MKAKKLISLALCVAMTATMLAACGSQKAVAEKDAAAGTDTKQTEAMQTETAASADTTSKGGVTLTVLVNQDWSTKPYMQAIWDMYQKESGNKLDIQVVPIDSGESIMKTKFATGEIPDIFMHFGGYGLSAYQPDKNFVDFSDAKWVSDIQDYVLPQAKYNGKVYGLPFWEASISGIIYNTEVFKKLGIAVPTTQEEFMAACEKIKQSGMTPMYLAFKDAWPLMYQFGLDNIALQDGVLDKLNSNQMKYADIPEFKKMVTWYQEMAKKGYFGDNYATNTWDGAPAALGDEKAAMMMAWDSYADTDLEPAYPGISSKFSIMPAFQNAVEGGSFEGPNVCLTFANKNSKNVETAKEFINFMADPVNYNKAFKGIGTTPVFKGMTDNKTTPLYESAKDAIQQKTVASTAWPSIIGFTQVEGAKYLQDMMIGNSTVDQCIADMDKDRMQIAKSQQVSGF